jgi:hypothetical protein
MAAEARSALLPTETREASTARLYAPREQPEWPPRGTDHCLHRRLQAADDRDARSDPVARCLHAGAQP